MGLLDILSPVSAVLGAAGSIAGAVGKGKGSTTTTPPSGFASLPPELQTLMMDKLFPKIGKYASSPFQGIPKRAINSQDTDPIFGSKARVQYDQQVLKSLQGASKQVTQAPETPTSTTKQNPAGYSPAQLGAQFLSGVQGQTPGGGRDLQTQIAQGRITVDSLGKALLSVGYNGTQIPTSMNSSGFWALLNQALAKGT